MTRTRKSIKSFTTIALIFLLSIISLNKNTNYSPVNAHSTVTYPKEIFSIWNDTSPTLGGRIRFDAQDFTTEWAYAAVYNLYDEANSISGKLFLQNDNTDFFIGLDVPIFDVIDPVADWGLSIYFDVDHNGYLSNSDKSIYFVSNSTDEFVIYRDYSSTAHEWVTSESGDPDTALITSGVYFASDFSTSYFDNVTFHRQYEIQIPFAAISSGTGESIGIGVEVTDDFSTTSAGITWPFIEDDLSNIRNLASVWGDLAFGEETKNSFEFLIEDNLNVKPSAIGYNNGTFMTTADIDGNGDFELVVSSNRTVVGDSYPVAIFDYVSGEYQRIWSSWTSSQSVITFPILDLEAYDFTQDGKDEIYAVGKASSILRFSDWNSSSNDFDTSEVIYSHTTSLTGFLTIGDGSNDAGIDLVFGDQNGYINIVEYNSGTDSFSQDGPRSPMTPKEISVDIIHDIQLGDIDADDQLEILFNIQLDATDPFTETQLLIYERTEAKYLDNPDDDLPATSSVTTTDYYGHTIVVADVDNDSVNETLIVGKDYLKIFEQFSFADPTPSLEILLNDGSSLPTMAGGVFVGDLNNDSINEIVFGSNNGTLYIGRVTDSGSELTLHLNWSADLGSSLGYHESILIEDLDGDGVNELAVGDNFGQIFIIGKGEAPDLTITNPSSGYVSSQETTLVEWIATDDHHTLHYFDVYIDGIFSNRVGGAQTGLTVSLNPGPNVIEIDAIDFSGLNTSKTVTVKFNVNAPQVTITSPANYFETDLSYVDISYFNVDNDSDFNHYEIYLNEAQIEGNTLLETYRVDLSSSGQGEQNITVVAVDDTLLEGRVTIFVIRDVSNPVIVITSPIDNTATKTSELEFTWTAYDNYTDIEYFEIEVDGSPYDSTTDYSATIIFGTDKSYTVEIIAFDSLGHSSSDTVTITRDTTKPTVSFDSITLPMLADGTYYTNDPNLLLSWNATDNILGSGISNSRITINGLLFDTYLAATTEATINLGNDSYKDIYITTYDEAGNFAEDYFAVILDRTAPTLSITNPENNFTTGLTYAIISWDSHDAGVGILKYDILINDVVNATITDSDITSYQVSIPNPETYNITVRATDLLGYYFEETINITHSPFAPTIIITSPVSSTSYSNSTTVTITWDIINLDVDHFEIYYNTTYVDSYPPTTLTADVYFGVIPIDEYHLYNITVYAHTTDFKIYSDYRWIIIDQFAPSISITTPGASDTILEDDLRVEWFSEDEKSGLDSFTIQISTISVTKDAEANSHILYVTGLDAYYNLTIFAWDVAGNKAFDTVLIYISLLAPDFISTLEPVTISNDPNLQFNLTVTNPRLGVKTVSIYSDGSNDVYTINYGTEYQIDPYWFLVNTTESDFLGLNDDHNLSISVIDRANRVTKQLYDIIIDQDDPTFWPGQLPILGSVVLSDSTNEITWSNESALNIYNLTVIFQEANGLSCANVTIAGDGYGETYSMIRNDVISHGDYYQYEVELDFNELALGEYTLIFTFKDIAGNSNSEIYSLSLIEATIPTTPITTTPQPAPPSNYLYIIVGASLAVVLTFILAISLRRPISNIGWKKELVVVAYILRSGLTTIFVPYSPEIVTDEQLFGGAMSGIRGILEEIIGKKVKLEVESVEFGEKTLLIYTGNCGDAILLVNNVKPIHSKLILNFTSTFEEEYSEALQDATHVSFDEFDGSTELVERFFGVRSDTDDFDYDFTSIGRKQLTKELEKPAGISDEESLIGSFYEEIATSGGTFDDLSDKTKVLVGDAIILVEKSLNDLIANNFKQAERRAKTAIKSLDIARQSKEPIENISHLVRSLPRIAEIVLNGADSGKNGEEADMYKAIELASQLFLEQIT